MAVLPWVAAGCLTRAQEQRLGDREAEKVEQQLGVVRDAALEAYVNAVGRKLAAVSERPGDTWRFVLLDTEEPNAFALPGGHVYVTRGLLALANAEDELAGVLGHEIGHVTARHSVKRIGSALATAPVTLATGLAGFAVGIVSPVLGRAVSGTGQLVAGGLVIAPFSRQQEHEADVIGQRLAARAGYDPAGIARLLQTLDRDAALRSNEERSFHFLDSHPMTPDRVTRTRERARELVPSGAPPVATSRAGFLARLDGLLVGPDPAQGIFRGDAFLHPELDLALRFPPGWKTVNAPTAVGAVSPDGDAVVALRVAATGTTVDAVVRESREQQPDLAFAPLEVRGLPAARTRTSQRGRTAEVTLIGWRGDVYAVVGQSAAADFERHARTFDAAARSFRALRSRERDAIRETRLWVRAARAGETPAAIAARAGSVWEGARVAAVNAVAEDAPLAEGALVKLGIPQPYTPRGR